MKKELTVTILLFLSTICLGQEIETGEYDSGLKLAYDHKTNKLTGYFENYTGWDEMANNALFSCIFYFEGIIDGTTAKIRSYYPSEEPGDMIPGTLEITDSRTVKIELSKEHGGCWNVQHFAGHPIQFSLEKEINWIQIRFIVPDKTYFYSDKSIDKKEKSFLSQNDIICINKFEDEWAYCTYYGKKIQQGWIRTSDLNKI